MLYLILPSINLLYKKTQKPMKKVTFLMFLCLFGYSSIYAQALMKEIPLQTQIENSNLVIEGKVIAKKSVWDDDHKYIYTINTVEVYKVFKGNSTATIDVITVGGTVGMQALIAHPSLKLRKGDIGIFALESNKTPFSKTGTSKFQKFKPYGLSQSFFKYNVSENIAVTPFDVKQNIAGDFYNEIKRYTKSDVLELKAFDVNSKTSKSNSSKTFLPPSAITLNKTTVTAGTKDVLTITGSGFGAIQGKVQFRDADSGGTSFVDALDSQVISWNDGQILVEVPSSAGTGTIRVEDSDGALSPLSAILTVLYAEINVETDPDDTGAIPLTAYQVQHTGQNGSGGMTWRMQTDFFNDTEFPGAKAAFMRSFDQWICETGINWDIDPTATTIDDAGSGTDGTNIIRFDNGAELNANTLGICYTWFAGCFAGGTNIDWYVSELDLVFNDNVNWHTGTGLPGGSQFDFESVALHELGHGHQLGHVIDPNNNTVGNNGEDVMHFAFSNSEAQRVLTANNSTAANSIQDRSTASAVCNQPIMVDLACNLSVGDAILDEGIDVYPNPASDKVFIKNTTFMALKSATLYDLSGRSIVAFDISKDSKLKTINLSRISSGVYFIKIASDEASITRKLVVD